MMVITTMRLSQPYTPPNYLRDKLSYFPSQYERSSVFSMVAVAFHVTLKTILNCVTFHLEIILLKLLKIII